MNAITIETVPNGWIVREANGDHRFVLSVLGVYTSIEELKLALPKLLRGQPGIWPLPVVVIDDASIVQGYRAPVCVAGDRTPETIGGNELTPSS